MIDREKVESILCLRFPAAPLDQIASAANAIIALSDESEHVEPPDANDCGGQQPHCAYLRVFKRTEVISNS